MKKHDVALALALTGLVGYGGAARPQQARVASSPAQATPQGTAACLHGPSETPDQAARRQEALGFARLINTTENTAHQRGATYYTLGDLHTIPAPPEGFAVQLSTDGATYTFSIKDTRDACHFAFFSDQDGLIYTAVPIR